MGIVGYRELERGQGLFNSLLQRVVVYMHVKALCGSVYFRGLCIGGVLGYNVATFNRRIMMAANSVVRARIDEDIKQEASIVLESMG